MSLIPMRCLQPAMFAATARLVSRPAGRAAGARIAASPKPNFEQRRFLKTETAPVLYSAHAKVKGARTGHVEGDDLKVDLTMAKALGGAGDKGKTNPEELLAAGYGACFQAAMNAVAATMKGVRMPTDNPDDSVVDATVHLVGDLKSLDLGLRLDLRISVRGVEKDVLDRIVSKAFEVCPFSRAVEGNVVTNFEVVVME
ncbi:OsmC/Ohr family [Xylariaceae sp. FL0255]|nr:OsmC/Ohr family [Xylariaceae sp. FL0255]